MARIAMAGFHHETNCFVDSTTDFAYFAAHRDRPPLVYGADVVKRLTGNSFAIAGFMRDLGARHDLVPLLWTSGGAGGMVTRRHSRDRPRSNQPSRASASSMIAIASASASATRLRSRTARV